MAEALINLLLEELVTVSFNQTKEAVKLISNAKTEVRKFSKTIEAIQAVMEDAEKQQVEKASVRIWLNGLNDVSYEMVDVLDEWNYENLKRQATGVPSEKKKTFKKVCFSISSSCFCFGACNKATHLYRIATKIKELNEKLAFIAAEKEQFGFHESSTRRDDEHLIRPLETSSFVDISKIFGREEATAGLLGKLRSDGSEEGKRVIVIPIVGMGGMGKTTLAQLAYNDKNVETHFELRIWVCVSKPFDGVKIAKAIISGTGDTPSGSTELQVNLSCMSRCLEGKKCLIVLDDVWTENQEEWESLKLPLIMETCAEGSKIVVTTRKKRVAEIMGATAHMINLEKLSDEHCLALFNSIAFLGREEDDATRFRAIGEKIAKKCDGLPLAAKTLGALMQYKKRLFEWQEVLDSKLWALEGVEQVFQPLLLSYYELAPAIRRCLLYCAIFSEDYLLRKHNLIDLWMSQDYLSGKDYKEKEKTGKMVFDTLVMRSFFQDIVEVANDWVYKCSTIQCKMHDIVHDFVQFLNKNECFTVEAKEGDGKIMKLSEEVRHLSLMYAPYSSPLSDSISVVNCKKLRTLTTFDSRMSSMDIKAITQVKCLRTLNLRSNDIRELPEVIGELIHLRYLDLSWNEKLEKLPDSLGNLYNLQTLLLMNCRSVRRLPENMGSLMNLRHLYNMACISLEYLPRGLARLTNLQTLSYCPVRADESDPSERFKLGELGSLDLLQGSLVIRLKGNSKDATSGAQMACLSNKKLYALELKISELHEDHVPVLEALQPHPDLEYLTSDLYGGTAVPSWLISLQSLRSLTLEWWYGCECLPSLGQLPLLELLHVEGMDKVKRVGDEFLGTRTSSSLLFPKLKKLIFRVMTEWEEWEGGVGAGDEVTIMPCLISLEIHYCPKLMNLPLFLLKTPINNVSIKECPSIVMPDWPENCVVHRAEDGTFERLLRWYLADTQIGEEITDE